jgi:hypothetical protein
VYTKFLSGISLNLPSTPNPSLSGRIETGLTPAKRVTSDSCLPDSPNSPAGRLLKSPKPASSPINAHGSPRHPSTRGVTSDVDAGSVLRNRESPRKPLDSPAKSPRKLLNSPAKSPRKLLNSPAKSPRKNLFSPAKTSTEVRVGESPRKTLLKSPEKKTIHSEGQQSQQAMSRSDLRR